MAGQRSRIAAYMRYANPMLGLRARDHDVTESPLPGSAYLMARPRLFGAFDARISR